MAAGEKISDIRDLRGTAFMVKPGWHPEGWVEIDSTLIDRPGPVEPHPDPYAMEPSPPTPVLPAGAQPVRIVPAAERVAARLRAGMVHINGGQHRYGSPFGGFKQSGNGRDKSLHALEKYTELKSTWIQLE